MRYEINTTGPNIYSLLNTKTGKYVVVNETMTVCSNVKWSIETGGHGSSECADVARQIIASEKELAQ